MTMVYYSPVTHVVSSNWTMLTTTWSHWVHLTSSSQSKMVISNWPLSIVSDHVNVANTCTSGVNGQVAVPRCNCIVLSSTSPGLQPSSQGLQLSLSLPLLTVHRCVEIPAANYPPRLHTLALAELPWKATLVMLLLTSYRKLGQFKLYSTDDFRQAVVIGERATL